MRFGSIRACDSVDKLNRAIAQIIACATSINTFCFYRFLLSACAFLAPSTCSFFLSPFIVFSDFWFVRFRRKKWIGTLKRKQLTSLSINYRRVSSFRWHYCADRNHLSGGLNRCRWLTSIDWVAIHQIRRIFPKLWLKTRYPRIKDSFRIFFHLSFWLDNI